MQSPEPRSLMSGRWMALPDFPDYHKWGFSLAALHNHIYVTGAHGRRGGGGEAEHPGSTESMHGRAFKPRELGPAR